MGISTKRSPLTPTPTVSVTTSNNIPPPPFGSGIPGQPGSGVPSALPHLANTYSQQAHGQHGPVKRHHLKNWTEAEPNRLVARSKGRTAVKGEKSGRDEARTVPLSAAAAPTTKSGLYTTLGRAPSTALNLPSALTSQVVDTQQERKVSAVSSCASGAEADNERDTSIDESDEVGEVSEALTFADGVNVGSQGEVSERGIKGQSRDASCERSREAGTRSVSPSTAKKTDKTGRKSPMTRSVTPASATGITSSSESSRPVANSTVRTTAAAPVVPHSVQGYDGGNVGVLGGGVKLGGGPSSSAGTTATPAGKHDQSGRSVSGQSIARSTGQIRSTSGSSAFAATGSESETTIGSGTEGVKSLVSGNRKRRGRPQQTRSPDVSHSRSREPVSHPHPHHWSPLTPSRMHMPPTPGTVPSPNGTMAMGMLGGGIAGQPGAVGYPIGPGTAAGMGFHQAYAGPPQPWGQMPVGGLGLPIPSSGVSPATPSTRPPLATSSVGRLSPTATQTAFRPRLAPPLPLVGGGVQGQPGIVTPAIGQTDNSTWRGFQQTMHAGPR